MHLDLSLIFNVALGLVGLGSVYGLIRADLKNMREKIESHSATHSAIFQKIDNVDQRINDHIEHHHLRAR